MEKNIFLIGIVIILAVAGFFLLSGSNNITNNVINVNENNVQVVKLSVQNGQYILDPSTIKKDIPVRLEADVSNMPGCSKSIVISEFNVRKTFTSKDNSIEFIPNKAGTFYITCSMNMYRGTFNVLGSDGVKSNYVQTISSSASNSCGASGGCGCGS